MLHGLERDMLFKIWQLIFQSSAINTRAFPECRKGRIGAKILGNGILQGNGQLPVIVTGLRGTFHSDLQIDPETLKVQKKRIFRVTHLRISEGWQEADEILKKFHLPNKYCPLE